MLLDFCCFNCEEAVLAVSIHQPKELAEFVWLEKERQTVASLGALPTSPTNGEKLGLQAARVLSPHMFSW